MWLLARLSPLICSEERGGSGMDGGAAWIPAEAETQSRGMPGVAFGEAPLPARPLDPGMGVAVARRTVFRPEDESCFGRVADRVALGNIALLGPDPGPE